MILQEKFNKIYPNGKARLQADKILVLELGEIVEQGTHEDFLQAGGQYATLFSLQAAGYQ
jgi:ABC-type multidrug transport system fused ATPase/permease subunit